MVMSELASEEIDTLLLTLIKTGFLARLKIYLYNYNNSENSSNESPACLSIALRVPFGISTPG